MSRAGQAASLPSKLVWAATTGSGLAVVVVI